jgi:ribosomal protein S18 acetylase RimI-like enzyme
MRLALAEQQQIGEMVGCRHVSLKDVALLGRLMYDAYAGTIDDEGETLAQATEEVRGTLAGKYGQLLAACSFLIEEDGKALAATLVTQWEGLPLLAFVMTSPEAKNRGLGSYLVRRSIDALLADGQTELYLFVTVGNAPAQHIYEKLGFEVVDSRTSP